MAPSIAAHGLAKRAKATLSSMCGKRLGARELQALQHSARRGCVHELATQAAAMLENGGLHGMDSASLLSGVTELRMGD